MKFFSAKKVSPEIKIIAVYVCVMLILSITLTVLLAPKIAYEFSDEAIYEQYGRFYFNGNRDIKCLYMSPQKGKFDVSTLLCDVAVFEDAEKYVCFYGPSGYGAIDKTVGKCYLFTYSEEQLADDGFKTDTGIIQDYSYDPDVIYLSSFDEIKEEYKETLNGLKDGFEKNPPKKTSKFVKTVKKTFDDAVLFLVFSVVAGFVLLPTVLLLILLYFLVIFMLVVVGILL